MFDARLPRRALVAVALLLAVLAAGCDDSGAESPGGGAGSGGGAPGGSGGSGGGAGGDGGGGGGGSGGQQGGCSSNADCPGAQPTCHERRCVVCVEDLDCPADAPACTDGACGRCTAPAACEGRPATPICGANGACLACLTSADCAAPTPICNRVNSCVQCMQDADCEEGSSCTAGACQVGAGCVSNADCNPGDVCVTTGGAPSGRCEELCNPEQGVPCPAGELCQLAGFDAAPAFEPLGICVLPTGGGAAGAVCDAGGEGRLCEVNLLCVTSGEGATEGLCSAMCDAIQGNCVEGFRCVDLAIATPDGATIGACLVRPEGCETDADCAANEICTIDQAAAGVVDLGCRPATGPGRGGTACLTDAECASDFCLLGACYGTCNQSADCSAGSSCLEVNFTLGDGTTGAAPVCLRDCVDDAGCGAGLACVLGLTRSGDELVPICANELGSVGAGGSCLRDEVCKSGTCVLGNVGGSDVGFCTGFCDDDSDCGAPTRCASVVYQNGPGADGVWGTLDDFYVFGSCRGADCTTDGDCAGGWACGPEIDGDDAALSSIEGRCVPPPGSSRGGFSCTANDACRSGACVNPDAVPEDCDNGLDDDGNGDVDCDDLACFGACHTEQNCRDGLDDDGDGAVDCADGDCNWECTYEGACGNGLDDDGDNLVDCADPDCHFSCYYEFECTDGLDNDGDGRTDCEDEDCRWSGSCQELVCDDGLDDDGDGFVDCQDPDCRWNAPCSGIPLEGEGDPAQCGNGLDDDGDGLVDCADPSCRDVGPCAESGCAAGGCCTDGLDNDGDGATDCADADCHGDRACNETGLCTNGIDDDGDGPVDCRDSDCSQDPACNENVCAGGNCCADGRDNDGDGGTDCADYDCFYTLACNEQYCSGGSCCRDGLDSDSDGRIDCDDPDCTYSSDCYEWSCTGGIDDDRDGLTDCEDPTCFNDLACRAAHFICWGACTADADCAAGQLCAPGVGVFPVPEGAGQYSYLPGCVCGTGLTACAAGCADLLTDGANCGSCGSPCDPGLSCVAGACQLP